MSASPSVSSQTKTIQVVNANQTETTKLFYASLKENKKSRIGPLKRIEPEDVDEKLPLIILCQSSTRLKPDVDFALNGIKVSPQCIMILIHTVARSNLPSVLSAEKLHGYAEYNNITFVDMGFDHDCGIYDCELNNTALQLIEFQILFRGTKINRIQIMHLVQTEITKKVCSLFFENAHDCDVIKLEKSNTPDEIDTNIPLIMLCHDEEDSADTDSEMKKILPSIKLPSKCVLVKIHTVPEKDLPSVSLWKTLKIRFYAAIHSKIKQLMKTSESFTNSNDPNIRTVDLGFNHHSGIFYDCDQNKYAFHELEEVLGKCCPSYEDIKRRPKQSSQISEVCTSSTQRPLLTDKPWRKLEDSGMILDDIGLLKPENIPNILFIGQDRAGKSSFIRSCLSVVADKPTDINCPVSALEDNTLKLKSYTDINNDVLKNFHFTECIGVDPFSKKVVPDDIPKLIKGHIENGYLFHPYISIPEDSEFYIPKPEFENETHCVVFVVDSNALVNGVLEEYLDRIKTFQNKIQNSNIPTVLVLTKADVLCEKVKEKIAYMFRSVNVEKAVDNASKIFCIGEESIHPVVNYETEFELTNEKNIPLLLAMREILQCATDKVQNDLKERRPKQSSQKSEVCTSATQRPLLTVVAGKPTDINFALNANEDNTLILESYTDTNIEFLKNFHFTECIGVDPFSYIVDPEDIFKLIKGHIENGYHFHPYISIPEDSESYRAKPEFENETPCVVFIMDSNALVSRFPDECPNRIKAIQNEIQNSEIPTVLIMTKDDVLCEKVKENIAYMFRSVKVKTAVDNASKIVCIGEESIPILLIMREILQCATKQKQVHNDEKGVDEKN